MDCAGGLAYSWMVRGPDWNERADLRGIRGIGRPTIERKRAREEDVLDERE